MPKFSNSKLVGACELWQPDYTVSANDDESMEGEATYISNTPSCPLGFGAGFPFAGYAGLKLTDYTIKNYNGGLYEINCKFKASTTEGSTSNASDYGSGETYNKADKEESINDTWTLTGGLQTRPISEHPNYQDFNAKEVEEKFAVLADGKLDINTFFEHGVAIPINPNDVTFNPSTYENIKSVIDGVSSDFLDRLIKGNTIYYAPSYTATINNIGEPRLTAHGLNELMEKLDVEFEVVSQNTVTENGIKRSTTTLQEKKD